MSSKFVLSLCGGIIGKIELSWISWKKEQCCRHGGLFCFAGPSAAPEQWRCSQWPPLLVKPLVGGPNFPGQTTSRRAAWGRRAWPWQPWPLGHTLGGGPRTGNVNPWDISTTTAFPYKCPVGISGCSCGYCLLMKRCLLSVGTACRSIGQALWGKSHCFCLRIP